MLLFLGLANCVLFAQQRFLKATEGIEYCKYFVTAKSNKNEILWNYFVVFSTILARILKNVLHFEIFADCNLKDLNWTVHFYCHKLIRVSWENNANDHISLWLYVNFSCVYLIKMFKTFSSKPLETWFSKYTLNSFENASLSGALCFNKHYQVNEVVSVCSTVSNNHLIKASVSKQFFYWAPKRQE